MLSNILNPGEKKAKKVDEGVSSKVLTLKNVLLHRFMQVPCHWKFSCDLKFLLTCW